MKSRSSFARLLCSFACFISALFISSQQLAAQNIRVFFVVKGEAYLQSSSATPTTAVEYVFDARVSSDPNTTTSASVQYDPPNGAVYNLGQGSAGELEFENDYSTKNQLDTAFPNGVYRMSINNSAGGAKVIDLNLGTGDMYPSVPHVSNYADLVLPKNPSQPLSIQWDLFSGGTSNDFIQVEIFSGNISDEGPVVYSSPGPNMPGALNGTHTNFTVPFRTLAANTNYSIELIFAKAVDSQAFDTNLSGPNSGAALFIRDTSLEFTTTNATDVTYYAVLKGKGFMQTNAAAPVLGGATPYFFIAEVENTTNNSVTSASVQALPSGPVRALSDDGGHYWEFEVEVATESELHTAYPDLQYELKMTGINDDTKTILIDLYAGGGGFPMAPQVSNFDAAQMIDPTQEFTLSWNAFTSGRANSFIHLFIEDNSGQGSDIVETGFWGYPDMIPASGTSFRIPPNLLQPGKSYDVELVFIDVAYANANVYEPGVPVPGIGAYFSVTHLNIQTLAPPAPVFTNTVVASGSILQVDLETVPGLSYVIETSTDFTNWMTVYATNATTELTRLQDPSSLGQYSYLFYRAHISSDPTFNFNFLHFAQGGAFAGGPNYTPNPGFPIAINAYSANVQVYNDPNLPMVNQVLFTGPAGSGLVSSPASAQNSYVGDGRYQSINVASPSIGPSGNWTVSYNGQNIAFMVSDPDAANRLVIILPTVNTSGGDITSVNWSYRAPGNGSDLGSAPGFMSNMQVQINTTGPGHNSPNFAPSTTSYNVPGTISWSTVTQIFMVYNDDKGNHYVVGFTGPAGGG